MDSPVDYAGPAACGGPFARLTLNSPHNRNALSSTLVSQLHQGLSAAEADPAVRLVVLGHTGGTFCAGADLSEAGGGDPRGDRERGAAGRSGSAPSARGDRERGVAGRSGSAPSARGDRERGAAGRSGSAPSTYEMAVARAREMTALLRAIVESPLPVVGAINGHVRAGGFGLVGACDMVVAGPDSTFALTEARIGVAPAIISLTLLPKLSPRAAARYYLTGEKFGAREAADIGLITMAADDVEAAVAALVADVGRGSPQGLAASKALTTAAVLDGFDRDAQRLTEESARLFVSDEAREGMLAFLQKRPPRWVQPATMRAAD
ncbi:enoyl-CoA hydratase family protein [Mycobacterium canetti]|uniref:enoyl-CoA hydratase family protein n=2 Tax=Mycobacterium tuberculosis complex TaxID=77643 RepID=UPI0002A5725B|nr:enoyl-CoA hydratase family protein [Mycobacterium canetti]CCK59014.1 Enoyl-CoA hydratase EchA7 [Mycobacterium canettii CIPT 140070010]